MAVRLSIRWRLTLWNASVLAFLLIVFALVGWLTLAFALRQRADSTVVETARAVSGAVIAERTVARVRGDRVPAGGSAARDALRELRAGDLDIVIADDAARVVAASRRTRVPGSRDGRRTRPVIAPPQVDTTSLAPEVRALIRAARTETPLVIRTLQLEDGARRAAALRVAPGDDETEPELVVAVLRSTYDDDLLLGRVLGVACGRRSASRARRAG